MAFQLLQPPTERRLAHTQFARRTIDTAGARDGREQSEEIPACLGYSSPSRRGLDLTASIFGSRLHGQASVLSGSSRQSLSRHRRPPERRSPPCHIGNFIPS